MIGDDTLASEVQAIEQEQGITTASGRKRIREVVEERYTAPE